MVFMLHGGAGERRPSGAALQALSEALREGWDVLKAGGAALDAVTGAIAAMENSGEFNAGAGANLQADGLRRLDASVMEGRGLRAGSVIGLQGFRNPVFAARRAMDLPNTMLAGEGAAAMARAEGLAPLPPPVERARESLQKARRNRGFMELYEKYFSTVGAVARDGRGDLAAAASTGGVAAMLPGRVGDTPIVGAGVYAENALGAVACTGSGEHILRLCLGKEICMSLFLLTLREAAARSLTRLTRMGGEGGVIAIDARGRPAIIHTTKYMAGGYVGRDGLTVKERFVRVGGPGTGAGL
jgi:beta-aspartyl-peptidase (threonine type)